MARKSEWILETISLGLVFVLGLNCASASSANGRAIEPEVQVLWGVKIPMRDGVKLNATIYLPAEMQQPLPAIFTLTPYTADTYHDRAWYFARHGYVFALVDVRGRGNSEGAFAPFVHDGQDGYDVVEWLAAQPWCNGKVAMWGGSYAGFDQWAALKEFPPHLATIVPAAAAHPAIDFPMADNIFYSYDMQWLTLTSGVTANFNLFRESAYWIARFTDLYRKHLPFDQLDLVVRNPSPIFHTWLAHPVPDAYWSAMVPGEDQYKRIEIPILTITGDYDGDQRGALTYYRRHMKFGALKAVAEHFLIIGPWDHAGTRTPRADVGGLHFGPASLLDLNRLHKEWYDWTMKGGQKPEFLKKRVAYYVTAADEWKYADSLDAVSNSSLTLYLHSGGGANDAFSSGSLSETKPGEEKPDQYIYDPLDARPAALEQKEVKNYLTDQSDALNLFGDGVIYHTAPFPQDTEISGALKFVVWMSLDVPDVDFQTSVYEIRSDGSSIALTDDALRARYRESLTEPNPVPIGQIVRYEFNSFSWFSRRIAQGSRLRLVLRSPNSIFLEKNYNSGGNVAEESASDARTARITVYHDLRHPSFLELPVVK